MKKGILAVVIVLVLLAVIFWPNRKLPPVAKPAGTDSGKAGSASLASFGIKDISGNMVSLSQFKGQVVLVNFWATWCAPCKIEIPWMIEFQKKYSPRGFTILGVSMDEEGRQAVAPFLDKERFEVGGQKEAVDYPILLGNDSIAAKFGGILGLPTSMLFTRDGQKIKTITGLIDHDELAKAIESQL
jgi:cytochrome c biogenesis protein CcmG/thiol:disulfide interchange protein DsbE